VLPNIPSFPPAAQLSYLSEAQQTRIHQASLEILDRLGTFLYDEESAALLRKAGAQVAEDDRVHIPPRLAEWAWSVAPRSVTLYNRQGSPVMPLEGDNVFFGNGSDCPNILDHRTGERRPGTYQDVVDVARVSDALPNVDFLMSGCVPSDIAEDRANRLQMRAMLLNSSKPIMFVTNDFESCVDNIRAAEVIAGGAEALRRQPRCVCYINVTSPLRHNAESLQKLLFLAEKGLPTTYTPVVLRGVNGPVTRAGAIALANAGELVGLILAELKREGTPILLSGGYNDLFDMRSMVATYGSPENYGGRPSMARFYGLPSFGLAGATDAKIPDEQAAAEAACSLVLESLSGMNLIHDVGYLESGKCYSLEQLVICDDLIGYAKRFRQALEVTDETLALDLVEQFGASSDYLTHQHTLQHYREDWYPRLLDRNGFERWSISGQQTLRQRAVGRLNKLLAQHQPEPLAPDIQREVCEILQ
jgi:trimethylamine---corrinoid protein Co-methyltransferase